MAEISKIKVGNTTYDIAIDESNLVHKAGAETISGLKTFTSYTTFESDTNIGKSSSAAHLLFFTGDSNNQHYTILQPGASSTATTLTLPTQTGTILTDADLVSADNLVTTDGVQTITGRKTFSLAPVMNGIWDSTKNSTIATFSYSSGTGSHIISSGHFIANGDDDSGINKPTDNTGASDLDTLYCNTGITLTDADGEIGDIKLAFPSSSGTLATLDKLPGIFCCNSATNESSKNAICEGFILPDSANKWYLMWAEYDNTYTGALTLNVNSTGAKRLYINSSYNPGAAFKKGLYIGHYSNSYWYFYNLIKTSTKDGKNYLLGSGYTTQTPEFATHTNCYMNAGHLYSYARRVLEWVDYAGLTTSGPTSPRQYSGTNIFKWFQVSYGAYSLVINYGLINKSTTTSTVSFGKSYSYTPIVLTSLMVDGDTQTQRGAPSSVSATGFSMSGNSGQAVAFVAIGIAS